MVARAFNLHDQSLHFNKTLEKLIRVFVPVPAGIIINKDKPTTTKKKDKQLDK